VHQCSKLPPEQWEEFLHWLFDYEFHLLGLPAPDSVIYLQVDPAVRRLRARYSVSFSCTSFLLSSPW
jgi:dTMP kinase